MLSYEELKADLFLRRLSSPSSVHCTTPPVRFRTGDDGQIVVRRRFVQSTDTPTPPHRRREALLTGARVERIEGISIRRRTLSVDRASTASTASRDDENLTVIHGASLRRRQHGERARRRYQVRPSLLPALKRRTRTKPRHGDRSARDVTRDGREGGCVVPVLGVHRHADLLNGPPRDQGSLTQ